MIKSDPLSRPEPIPLAELAPRLAGEFGKSIAVCRSQLDNGLRILSVKSPSSPILATQIHVAAGNRDVVKGLTGLAHCVEHMMFKTPNMDYDQEVESLGGACNAYTMQDTTSYVCESLAVALPEILELESTRFIDPLIEEDALASELEVILEERLQSVENSPTGLFSERMFAEAFPDHPYGWSILGSPEDLRQTRPEHCREFIREFYTAKRMVLAVAGPLDHSEIHALAERHLGKLSVGTDPNRRFNRPALGPRIAKSEITLRTKAELSATAFLGLLPGTQDLATARDLAAAELLGVILGWGDSSRLIQKLVFEEQIALDVEVGLQDYELGSLLLIDARSTEPGSPAPLRRRIREEIELLAHQTVSIHELEKAKTILATDYIRLLKSSSNRAELMGTIELAYPSTAGGFLARECFFDIQPQDIQGMARNLLAQNSSVVVDLEATNG